MGSFSIAIISYGYINSKIIFAHSTMNKIILALFLFVIVLSVQSGSSSPVGRVVRDADPWKRGGGRRRYNSGYNSGSRVNQGLKNHGRQKFATGAGLWALGAVTGNQGWQNT